MTKLKAPFEKINAAIKNNLYSGTVLDIDFVREMGFFVIKNAIPREKIEKYYNNYQQCNDLTPTKGHVTNVTFTEGNSLEVIVNEPELLAIAKEFYKGNVGFLPPQIFRKDRENKDKIFLHNDICYMTGWFERYSFFIALTDCNKNNGGIMLYPGTHQFGLLGDAGEINPHLVEDYPAVQASMQPGDLLVMHSAIWHCSSENIDLSDRVYLEIKIQDANDPTTTKVLCGSKSSPWGFDITHDELFKNSRTQRLKKFYNSTEKNEGD